MLLPLVMGVFLAGCMHLGVHQVEQMIPVKVEGEAGTSSNGGQEEMSGVSDYTRSAYDTARVEGKTILIYFEANWCPTCRAQRPVNEMAFADLSGDSNVVIFVSNYKDSEETKEDKELQLELEVPYQHTFVILGRSGRVEYKHTGELSREEIVAKVREVVKG